MSDNLQRDNMRNECILKKALIEDITRWIDWHGLGMYNESFFLNGGCGNLPIQSNWVSILRSKNCIFFTTGCETTQKGSALIVDMYKSILLVLAPLLVTIIVYSSILSQQSLKCHCIWHPMKDTVWW